MWEEVSNVIGCSTPQVEVVDAGEILREARRYCPEFPFEPALEETRQKSIPFYEDYRLVCLAPTSGDEQSAPLREVYGFYAPGDFRPLDGYGRSIELLNDIAPLQLTSETVKDYTLLRLVFELSSIFAILDNSAATESRLARIVSTFADLPLGDTKLRKKERDELAELLAAPKIEMVPEWEPYESVQMERGNVFRVSASAVLYYGKTEFELIRVLAQVAPDGVLIVSRYPERSGRLPLGLKMKTTPLISVPRHTRTAMPVREWQMMDTEEAVAWREVLAGYGVGGQAGDGDEKQRAVILRTTELSFYRSYKLLEILESKGQGYRRSYALFRTDKLELRPLTGAAFIIHDTNRQEGELKLDAKTAPEYLRFFCWAIHGPEGPFYVPRTMREIPLLSAPSEKQHDVLAELDFSVRDMDDAEAERLGYSPSEVSFFRRKAHVAYASAVVEAWFVVEGTGKVQMIQDDPVVPDLVIHKEHYGRDNLFVLNRQREPSRQRITDIQALGQSPPVQKVLWYDNLKLLRERWSDLPPQEVSSKDATPELKDVPQPLRTRLSQLSPEQVAASDALRFLHALVTQPAAEQKISPADFLQSLKSLLSLLHPEQRDGSQGFMKSIVEQGRASALHVEEAIVLTTASLKSFTPQEGERHE